MANPTPDDLFDQRFVPVRFQDVDLSDVGEVQSFGSGRPDAHHFSFGSS